MRTEQPRASEATPPAIHVETVFGDDALPAELSRLGDYVALVDPIAFELCRHRLPAPPVVTLVPDSLERSRLERLSRELTCNAPIVAIGGGLVIDAAKFLAVKRETRPLLVPSITSSNAPFSDTISVRERGTVVGSVFRYAPKRVVVDYTLIRAADRRLNRAGYADLLAGETALADWRLAADAGLLTIDHHLYDKMAAILTRARTIAADVGAVSRAGVQGLMLMFAEISELLAEHPDAPLGAGSEHLIAWNLERVTGKPFVHGEAVASGAITAAHLQDIDVRQLRATLGWARVDYRLDHLGVTWDEYEYALRTVTDYNRRFRGFCSILDRVSWTPKLLAAVRAALGG